MQDSGDGALRVAGIQSPDAQPVQSFARNDFLLSCAHQSIGLRGDLFTVRHLMQPGEVEPGQPVVTRLSCGGGKLLDQASKLLVHISGPPNLTFAEISVVMQEIATQACDHTLLHLGITTLADTHAPITVILIGRSGSHVLLEQSAVRQRPIKPKAADEPRLIEVEPAESDPIVEAPIVQRLPKPIPTPSSIPSKIRQETLQFEPVARGRFEKIEPTMVEGEDLDIPTFQRRNLK